MKKNLMRNRWLMLSLAAFCSFTLSAQEGTEVTNAFLDLQRKGDFSMQLSEMQTPASADQLNQLLAEKPVCNYFLFTEVRSFDISMDDAIPARWTKRPIAERAQLHGVAAPGEYYTFQLGLFAPYQTLDDVSLTFYDLKNERGERINKQQFTCFNQTGNDVYGKSFNKTIDVAQHKVQALWCGLDLSNVPTGTYRGKLSVKQTGRAHV